MQLRQALTYAGLLPPIFLLAISRFAIIPIPEGLSLGLFFALYIFMITSFMAGSLWGIAQVCRQISTSSTAQKPSLSSVKLGMISAILASLLSFALWLLIFTQHYRLFLIGIAVLLFFIWASERRYFKDQLDAGYLKLRSRATLLLIVVIFLGLLNTF